MNLSLNALLVGVLLLLVQVLAALPWLAAAFLSRADLAAVLRQPLAGRFPCARGRRAGRGRRRRLRRGDVRPGPGFARGDGEILYAALLQMQIALDLFLLVFALLLRLWPEPGGRHRLGRLPARASASGRSGCSPAWLPC